MTVCSYTAVESRMIVRSGRLISTNELLHSAVLSLYYYNFQYCGGGCSVTTIKTMQVIVMTTLP